MEQTLQELMLTIQKQKEEQIAKTAARNIFRDKIMAGTAVFGYIKESDNTRSLRKIKSYCSSNNLDLTRIYYGDEREEMIKDLRWGGRVIIHKIRDLGSYNYERIPFFTSITRAACNKKKIIVSILEYDLDKYLGDETSETIFGCFSSVLDQIDKYISSDDEA